MKQYIRIRNQHIVTESSNSRLSASICDPSGERELWFEVPNQYEEYLCVERADAFVVGLLNLAQRKGYDIVCDAPVSADLKYRLESTLIPALAKQGRNMYEAKIDAQLAEEVLPNAGAVGTGCSCGIDSMHVLKNHWRHPTKSLQLTHLVLNNAGAFRDGSEQYDTSSKAASVVAKEMDLPLIVTDSNIASFYDVPFEEYNTYANMFCVLALRKLWRTFFYGSSGHDLSKFSLTNNEDFDSGYYDLMTLSCLSTSGLTVYSEGASFNRFEKTRDIVDFPMAHSHLNVCQGDIGHNCSTCEKCRRTLLALDALGCLEAFTNVFDLKAYRKNRARFIGWALWRKWQKHGGDYTNDALAILLPKVRIVAWGWALVYVIRKSVLGR